MTFPIKATRALFAAGGSLHTDIEAVRVGERRMFWLCLEIGMIKRVKDPFRWQLEKD